MKRIVILLSVLALGISAGAQINQHSNYIGFNLGGGVNTLLYNPVDGTRGLGWGYLGEVKYIHFFGRHIGFGFGAQFDMVHATTTYDFTEVTPGLTHPDNGQTYNLKTVYNNWKERQRVAFLNVPIELFYRNKISERWSYMIGVGAELNYPLFGSYTADEGSYELRATFPSYGSYDVHHMANHGFDEYTADADADIELSKLGVSVIAEIGFNYALGNHWGLNFGIYGGYGITSLIDSASDAPIIKLNDADASKLDYAGTLTSNQIDALHLLNVGVKVGVNFGWSCKHGEGAAAGAAAAGTAAALTSYDNNQNADDQNTNKSDDQVQSSNVPTTAFGNEAGDDEAEAAAREARCNARRMNNPDMAQALSNVDADIAKAEQMANESGSEDAKAAVEDAKAKAADAKAAYNKGKYCKAYDLFNEAYGDIANSYAADANAFAAQSGTDRSSQAAQDAELYADAAHKDGLDCAMASSRNAKINADIARGNTAAAKAAAEYTDPNFASQLVNEAVEMAGESGSKAAQTDAKDASGKVYRGNYADAYAAAAKSFAESAEAYAAKCGKPEHKEAAQQARQYAEEAATAARMGEVAAAYKAARKAQEAARIAASCETVTDPAAAAEINKLLEQISATVYFGFNATQPDITNKVDLTLRAVSKAMSANKNIKLNVTGHTDNVGSAEGNMKLGKRRADAVKQLMVSMGAPAANIKTSSKGQNEPAVENDTDEHRYQNRRAVIKVK